MKLRLPAQVLLPNEDVHRLGIVYSFYRVGLAVFLCASNIALARAGTQLMSLSELVVSALYALLAIFFLLILWRASIEVRRQLLAGFGVDVIILTMMIYNSAQLDVSLALFCMVVMAASFLLLTFLQATLVMGLAIFVLFYQQILHAVSDTPSLTQMTDVMLLCSAFVGVGLLSHTVSQRLATASVRVAQQRWQIAQMTKLHEEVVQHMPQGAIIVQNNDILLINGAACTLLDVRKSTIKERHHSLWQWLIKPNCTRMDYEYAQPDGSRQKIGMRATTLSNKSVLFLVDDLSREESHAQKLKLASLGTMAASIAHEVKNPLSAIMQSAQMLDEFGHDDKLTEIILSHSRRVVRIIDNVSNLSRQRAPKRDYIDIVDYLQNFVAQYFGNKIALISNGSANVLFDPDQLEQVLLNLCQNALRHADFDTPSVKMIVQIEERTVFVDVIDNGKGVDEADIGKLFSPFFTKSQGGTGLGLYLSQAFADANGGDLIYSPHPNGACFRLKMARGDSVDE